MSAPQGLDLGEKLLWFTKKYTTLDSSFENFKFMNIYKEQIIL